MDRTWLLLVVVALGLGLLALMIVGWRARSRRQSDLPAPAPVPSDAGETLGVYAGRYVATSLGGQPLERVTAHGLGFRGLVEVRVDERGVLLDRAGERAIWIPRDDLDAIRRATWTIDRVVEPDGLTVIDWRLGDRAVETALRLDDPLGAEAAIISLTTGRTAT